MATVFVSHAGEDSPRAATVRDWLVEDGHDVFLDRDLRDGIVLGDEWEARLYERLRWADAMVCVVTSAYVSSAWCAAEVGIARSQGSRLLPIRAESGVMHPLLSGVQYADVTGDPGAARDALAEALRRVDQTGGSGWADGLSPFPGLRPFTADLHRAFFGRAEDVERLAGLLRSPAERLNNAAVLVVGPSGCGKSSVLRAGLLPMMAEDPAWWTLRAFTPGVDPVAALTREFVDASQQLGHGWQFGDVRAKLDAERVVEVVDELLSVGKRRPRRLLVAIDQLEELLTQTPPESRAQFVELLRSALTGPVDVVATLRPEFLDRLLRDPDLARLPIATQMVRPLRRETLRSVIEGPCRLAGLTVSEELVSSLIDDTDGGEALPLLAFTLSELGDGLARGEELSVDRYRSLGGVRGALIRQADAALADAMAATGRSQAAVIASLLRLVTVDEQGRPTRWQVTRTDLPDDVSAELDCFVNRRLLTIDTIAGDAVIGASHEAFFTAWPPLDEAITEVASALRARRLLEDAALEWNSAERSPDRLWERGQLAAAVTATGASVRAREVVIDRVHITKQGREFLYASIRHDRFRRGRAVGLLSVLLALAVTAALVAVVQQQTAHRQQQVAQEQALLATSRQLIAKAEADLDTDPRTALMLNIAAHRIHPDSVSYSSLQQSLTTTPYAGELPGVDSAVSSVSYSSTGRYLAVGFASGAVMLWDMAGPAGPRLLGKPFTGFASPVNAVFDHGEYRLVTASTSGTVVIWDLTDLQRPRQVGIPLTAPKDPTDQSAWLAPDGTLLATSSRAHPGVQLWDLTESQRILPIGPRFAEQPTPILSVGFSADSKMIATGGQAGVPVQLWDLSRPVAPRQLSRITPNPSDVVRALAFSADNKQLAVGGDLRGARLWQIEDPTTPRATAAKPSGTFFSAVIFSPRGATLATTGNRDTGLTLWNVTNPDRPQQVERLFSGDSDLHAAFSPDGHLVASGSLDGHVTLWNLNRAGRPRNLGPPFVGHQGTHKEIYTLTIANDGTMLATGGRDGSVVLWSIADPARPRRIDTLRGTDESVDAISFAPDGSTLAIGGMNGETTLWDLTDRNHPRQLGSPIRGSSDNVVRSMVFSADGTTLTVGTDRGTTYWDVHDRTQPRRVADVLQDDGVLNIWRLPNGHVLALLRGSSDDPKPSTIAAPSIQPTRSTTGTDGGSAGSQSTGHPDNPNGSRLWDITDPAHPHQLGPALIGHTAPIATAALSAAGDLLATSDTDGTTILWDVTNPDQARRIGDSMAPHGHVSSIVAAFTPRTDLMATGGIDGNAYLWDLGNRSAPRRFGPALAANLDAITRISFTPSGQILATAGSAGDVVLWDLRPAYELRTHLEQAACLVTGRGLDRDEWSRNLNALDYQNTCP